MLILIFVLLVNVFACPRHDEKVLIGICENAF